jgi:hypothetical protein
MVFASVKNFFPINHPLPVYLEIINGFITMHHHLVLKLPFHQRRIKSGQQSNQKFSRLSPQSVYNSNTLINFPIQISNWRLMKKIVNLAIIMLLTTATAHAQYDLGDAELNASLKTIIDNGKVHFSEFRSFVMGNLNVSGNKYDFMESELGMHTGDIYLAAEIAKITGRSIDDVIASYKKHKKEGWGVISKEMTVTPGSEFFERLKDDAYRKANGKPRPKPQPIAKPVSKSKSKPKTNTKSATQTKTKAKTKSTQSTKPKATTEKPKQKN